MNGFTIVEAIHEEVLNLIKGKDEIELKVTSKLQHKKSSPHFSLSIQKYVIGVGFPK